MEVDGVAGDRTAANAIPPETAVLIDALLSKEMTDVYATEAMQKVEFEQVVVSVCTAVFVTMSIGIAVYTAVTNFHCY